MYHLIFCIVTDGFPEHHPPLKYVCRGLDGDPKAHSSNWKLQQVRKPHKILERAHPTAVNALPKEVHLPLKIKTKLSAHELREIRQLQLLQGYKIPTFRKYKQEMERSVSRSNQRNMLMMSVRDCGDPSYAEVFSSEDGPICMMHRKSQT
ncbi:hypothetical protein QQF64_001618, partial [Cirrhinus molitorella]